ncbi:MAG: RNA polymerase sigma factor [Phycisphaerales bacterium]|nr:MAG: RNA polymerase sigma factor [Phycisphaerales bacterium]
MENAPSGQQDAPDEATNTLVSRLREGDSDAASMLDEQYREPLLRFCWGYLRSMDEAEDALQNIWYKVLTASHIPARFRPWVYRIARNESINLARKRAKQRGVCELPAASQIDAYLTGQLTRIVKGEAKSHLEELVAKLSDAQREALRLRYVEGLSRSEIAEVLDTPESVVKSRLFEGLKRLRDHTSLMEGL